MFENVESIGLLAPEFEARQAAYFRQHLRLLQVAHPDVDDLDHMVTALIQSAAFAVAENNAKLLEDLRDAFPGG